MKALNAGSVNMRYLLPSPSDTHEDDPAARRREKCGREIRRWQHGVDFCIYLFIELDKV